ncbi:histidine--tRNA ligase [Candidatus Azambacteria bacterium]|nr:histidine--tRNA ligase [Candidatus Azambacteria bacterium]
MARTKKQSFQTPKGTFDILPSEQKYWEKVREVFKNVSMHYGFGRIDTPIFEDADLYEATVGETTDIIERQMYVFKSKGKDTLALRPEGTASIARSYVENGMINLSQPVKLSYIGPMFRYEQPQSGRYRQFHQVGFEILGDQDPVYDAQIINVFLKFCAQLGLKNLNVEVNSIGCKQCRASYRTQLLRYYKPRLRGVCADCKKRAKLNPLRLLDCKEEKCQPIKANAPSLVDNLCKECHDHFKLVLEFLDELAVPYSLNPHMVRGLDYYTKTVFEVFLEDEHLEGGSEKTHKKSKLAIGGGGRFDDLIKMVGGKSTPAVGAALGMERVIGVMKKQGIKVSDHSKPQVFLVQVGDLGKKKCVKLFDELSDAGLHVLESFGRNSLSSQLRIADKFGAKMALIIGQKEAIDGDVIMRDMESGAQENIPIEKIVKTIKERIKK